MTHRKNRAKKSLGQHFLTDIETCNTVVRAGKIDEGSRILEVGPGQGFMTRVLLEAGAQVVAVEKDADLAPTLQERFAGQHLTVVEEDFLDTDWESLGEFDAVVGNLPYNVGMAIVSKACEHWKLWERAVFMLQLEVVQRLCAEPGSKAYGVPSILVRTTHTPSLIRKVSPGSFKPRPKVHSALVELTRLTQPRVDGEDRDRFINFTGDAFRYRRKTAQNAVSRASGKKAADLQLAFEAAEVDPGCRLETVDVDRLIRLWRAVSQAVR